MHYTSMPDLHHNDQQRGGGNSLEEYGGAFDQVDNRSHVSSFESYQSFIQSIQQ